MFLSRSYLPKISTLLRSRLPIFPAIPKYSFTYYNKPEQYIENYELTSQSPWAFPGFHQLNYKNDLILITDLSHHDRISCESLIGKYLNSRDSTILTLGEIQSILGIFSRIANAHKSENNEKEAIKYLLESLTLVEKSKLNDTLQIASINFALGSIYLNQNDLVKAENHIKEANKVWKMIPQNTEATILGIRNTGVMARIYFRQNKLNEAFTLFHHIINKVDQIPDPELLALLPYVYQDLGMIHYKRQQKKAALDSWAKGLSIAICKDGEISPSAEFFYGKIAMVYYEQGECETALSYAKKAYQISLRCYSEQDPQVFNNLSLLGQIFLKKGDLKKALTHFKKVLKILQKDPSQHQVELADLYVMIAQAEIAQSKTDKALTCFEKSVLCMIQAFGENSVQVAEYYLKCGNILEQTPELSSEAIVSYKKALRIFENNNKHTVESLIILSQIYGYIGQILYHQGKFDDSIKYWKESERIFLEVSQDESQYEKICNHIGEVYRSQKDYEKSIYYFEKAAQISDAQNCIYKPNLGSYYRNLGDVCKENQQLEKALDAYRKALDADIQAFGQDHGTIKILTLEISRILKNQEEK